MPHLVQPTLDTAFLAGPQPEIEAGTLTLRRWAPKDAQQLVDAFRDRAIQKWHVRTLETQDEADGWISDWKRRWRNNTGASWAVVPADDRGTVLGQVAFRTLFPADGMAECSYWVASAWRRQGVATQATRALGDWAIDTLKLERLELVHSTKNTASCRVALHAGFDVEGTKRRLQQHEDGWHDMHLHSRIRHPELSEAPQVRAAGPGAHPLARRAWALTTTGVGLLAARARSGASR